MFKVLSFPPSLSNLQKCHFSENLPPEYNGKYAYLRTSSKSCYIVRIFVNPLLQENVCFLDSSVQCGSDTSAVPPSGRVSLTDLEVIPSIKHIKAVHIMLIFNSVWDRNNWALKENVYARILKDILSIFVLFKDTAIFLYDKSRINKIGIHSIIVKNIGINSPGKITDSSKVKIVSAVSYDRYSLRKSHSWPIPGLKHHSQKLKELLLSHEHSLSSSNHLSSSLKILILGPDGCGKKSLVKSVASECGAIIVSINGPELSRPEPGESERLLKLKFDEADLHSEEGPTIILLSRLESMSSKVGRVSAELIHLLDSASQRLVIIATSASPHLLKKSSAFISRFHHQVFIAVPSEDERCEMVTSLSAGLLSADSALQVARKTPGFVLADVLLLLSKAKRQCLMETPKLCAEGLMKGVLDCLYQVEGSATRGELGLVRSEKLKLEDLGGLESVKKLLIQSIVWPLSHPQLFSKFNIPKSTGVLLYGPPGCAKTTLARCIASASELTFLSVSAADLLSPFVGDAELALTNLFHRARNASPTLLFIDEIDALVGSRSDKESGPQERLLTTLLVEMDGVGTKVHSGSYSLDSRVSIVGATNRPDCVDAALLRPGRLDRLIYVPPPSFSDRLQILQIITKNVPLGDSVDLKFIAENTELYSGADLKNLSQEAGLQALMSEGMDADLVKEEHWLAALKEIPPSLTPSQLEYYAKFLSS